MAKWVCPVCGYVYEGENPPEKCPQCGVPGAKFLKQGGCLMLFNDIYSNQNANRRYGTFR